MKKNRLLLSFAFLMLTYPIPDALGATGRELLFNHGNPTYSGLLAANQKFEDGLSVNPNDQEANLFYAVTRVGAFALEDGSGAGLETLRDVFEAFGMTRNSISFFFENGLPYDTPPQLPGNSPSGEDIRQFLAGPCISLLDGALANLDKIGSSFQTTLTADETGDQASEVDYGDVLLLKSTLQAFKATIGIISSYDIDVDPIQIAGYLNNPPFNINTDLLNPNPDFLNLLSGGSTTLNNAETDITAAINNYNAASTFIRSESDNQENDLITLDPEETTNETEFRVILGRIKDSLKNNRPVEMGDDALRVDFSEFFDDPVSIRDYLPTFTYNAYTGEYYSVSVFPDTTFSGILPDGLPQETRKNLCMFNGQAYAHANPDLPDSWTDEQYRSHFNFYGYNEGRDVYWNATDYVSLNTDLAGMTDQEAFSHWVTYGKNEGRVPWFQAEGYRDANGDLAGMTDAQALSHWINYGRNEGRIQGFDVAGYLELNDYLPQNWTYAEALNHYYRYGQNEGLAFDAYMEVP